MHTQEQKCTLHCAAHDCRAQIKLNCLCTKWGTFGTCEGKADGEWITQRSLHLPYGIGSCRQELRKACNNLFTRCQACL